MSMRAAEILGFDTYDREGICNVVIETPRGSRNKFKYDVRKQLFFLRHILPVGACFPFDFGFLPSTKAADGDPLDILVLMDAPTYTGCLVHTRLIGIIEADQTQDGKTERNDRLIGVAVESREHRDLEHISDINENVRADIEHFFVSYNIARGREFKVLGTFGPEKAMEAVRRSMELYHKGGK